MPALLGGPAAADSARTDGTDAMQDPDDFSTYHAGLLEGRYDCVDRMVLNAYFPLGQTGGGFRHWWRLLTGSDKTLDTEHLQRMAGDFSRRVHAYAKKHGIPIEHCKPDERKHRLAEKRLPQDPNFRGVFLILVGKAPARVWKVKRASNGQPHLEPQTPWPYVNHYHFHIIDPDWGHLTVKISGHPPFGCQIMLNGHEWVERRARQQTRPEVAFSKAGNCFVGGCLQAVDRIADTLRDPCVTGRLTQVCDRWVYSACLCFGLSQEEQRRSAFRYQYSCYQLEHSRNLLFKSGRTLDEVFQALIDRSRGWLDVPRLKTIFGRKRRPNACTRRGTRVRIERVLDESDWDTTVFKVHWGKITLKIYDKGKRVLRVEAIAHNVSELRLGRSVDKLPEMVGELQRMTVAFLQVVQAADVRFLDTRALDNLHEPTQRGARRVAGVDLNKERVRAVAKAAVALASNPAGFTSAELSHRVHRELGKAAQYGPRQAVYDLAKLRGKSLAERVGKTKRYRLSADGIRILVGMTVLRDKVIKPVVAGMGKRRSRAPLKYRHPLDVHYENLQIEMRHTLKLLQVQTDAAA